MPLLLRIAEPSDPNWQQTQGGGRLVEVDAVLRIGRAPDNDLVLPDPDRVLSKQHCVIRREEGRYVVLDGSANGTFLNDGADRLVRDHSVPLVAGDAIRLGAYVLTVVSVILPDGGPAEAGIDLLGPVSNAPAPQASPQQGTAPQDIDAFLDSINSSVGHAAEDILEEHAANAWQAVPTPVAADPDHAAPGEEALPRLRPRKEAIPDHWDPLAEIGAANARHWEEGRLDEKRPDAGNQSAAHQVGNSPSAANPHGASPGLAPVDQARSGEVQPGHAQSGVAQSGVAQSGVAQSGVAQSGVAQSGVAQSGVVQSGVVQSGVAQSGVAQSGVVQSGVPQSGPVQPGVAQPGAVRSGAAQSAMATGHGHPQPTAPGADHDPTSEPSTLPQSRDAGFASPVAPPPTQTDESRRAVDLLLTACGVDPATLSDAKAAIAAERAGKVLRIAVNGMLQILGSRSVAKQEFGMQRTTISRGANNVMKFVNTAEEALQMLLCNDIPGFLPPENAMRETVSDINAHHLALLSGVRAAFADTLRRLDPAGVERALPHHATDAMLPALRKARAWDAFRAKYAELECSLAGNGHDVFGGEFARAYAAIETEVTQARARGCDNAEEARGNVP